MREAPAAQLDLFTILSLNSPDRTSAREHSLWQAAIFRFKTALFQGRRAVQNIVTARLPMRRPFQEPIPECQLLAESRSDLWSVSHAHERSLQAGKVENLRVAARALQGVRVPGGSIFSFWRQVGRPIRSRGFVTGRELREGCLIPSIGGGLCQLSNALYDCALQAGLEIVERHAHTQIVPGSLGERGRDATVFWNYVDLRFRARHDLQLEVLLDAKQLTVRFHGRGAPAVTVLPEGADSAAEIPPASCASCGLTSCFRNTATDAVEDESTAVLVDDYWPEFDHWLQGLSPGKRFLFLPLQGRRFGVSRYGWATQSYARVRQFPIFAAQRSLTSRRLSGQGAERQQSLLRNDERLAQLYARRLTFETTHLIVTQTLLPFLWQAGVLGGRTFDVLLTRWPLTLLQQKLDAAARLHPESGTLADFRADPRLAQAEQAALAAASRVITAHSALARLFSDKTVKLEWTLPTRNSCDSTAACGQKLLFPASTLGRKGAYELREVLREMNCELAIAGPVLEAPDFWSALRMCQAADSQDIGAAVLPSFVENRPPRSLLAAIARGLPVIATPECGVEGMTGVVTIEAGDKLGLATALRATGLV